MIRQSELGERLGGAQRYTESIVPPGVSRRSLVGVVDQRGEIYGRPGTRSGAFGQHGREEAAMAAVVGVVGCVVGVGFRAKPGENGAIEEEAEVQKSITFSMDCANGGDQGIPSM